MTDEYLPVFNGLNLEHPMRKPPMSGEKLPAHIRSLRTEIAGMMTALDGQRDFELTVGYLTTIYDLSKIGHAGNWLWMLGQIQWQAIKTSDRLTVAQRATGSAQRMRMLRRNQGTIENYATRLSRATVKDISRE